MSAYEIERLKALLQVEKNKSMMLGETISSLKQDKELLQQELTKKAELICEFLQDQLRPGTHLNIHKSVQKCKIYIYRFKKNNKKNIVVQS